MKEPSKIRRKFEMAFAQSELDELLALTSSEAVKAGVIDLALSAQALSGNLERALWHFEYLQRQKHRPPEEHMAAIHFSIGVALTRVSKYKEAKTHFLNIAKWRHGSERSKFFLWQSLGFYSFFTGEFQKSAEAAHKALAFATQGEFAFGELLAEELLGHSLIESGQIRLGMRHMRHALKRARQINNRSLQQSFRLLLLLNEARFGLDWSAVDRLKGALEDLHPSESYSRNAVKLELANQLSLRGELNEAYRVLDQACDSIYSSQNRRQIAQLNLRLAYLTAVRGRVEEASHLLRAAELQLHSEVDLALWLKMQGLREQFNLPVKAPLPIGPSQGMHARIVQRRVKRFDGQLMGEDRLGDLYDRVVQKDEQILPELIEHKLLFFLYPYFDLATNQRALVFDLLPRGLLILDNGNIEVVTNGFSNVLRRILEALAEGHQSKTDLVTRVWGYKYDPARHDSLVYSSISKLRKLLGSNGAWVEMDSTGYRLLSGVQLRTNREQNLSERERPSAYRIRPPIGSALNFRQLRILAAFDRRMWESCSVEEMIREYQISRATATRDLSQLKDLGFLNPVGRARATRYLRTDKNVEDA